jgi:hypothetical protein
MCIFRTIFHYFNPSLYSFWTGRNLSRATHAVKWGLSFSGLIRRTAPFSRLLQLERECVGLIVTRIPTVHCYGYENTHIIYVYNTVRYQAYDRLSDFVVVTP